MNDNWSQQEKFGFRKDMTKLSTQMNTHIQELKLQMMENSLNKFGQNKYREITISILNSIKQYFMG